MESNSLTTRLCAALAVFVLAFGMLVPASAEEMTSQQGSVEGTSQTVAGQQEDPKPTTVIQQVDSSFKYDGKEYRLDGNLRVDGYVVCTEKKEEE